MRAPKTLGQAVRPRVGFLFPIELFLVQKVPLPTLLPLGVRELSPPTPSYQATHQCHSQTLRRDQHDLFPLTSAFCHCYLITLNLIAS